MHVHPKHTVSYRTTPSTLVGAAIFIIGSSLMLVKLLDALSAL